MSDKMTRKEMLEELDKGTVIMAMIPEIRDAIRVLIEEHGKLVERLEKKIEELAKENYKLKEGDDEW